MSLKRSENSQYKELEKTLDNRLYWDTIRVKDLAANALSFQGR